MGAAALDLAHVAAGVMAAYWEAWLNPWDAAAGVLLVREAGGQVTDYAGQPWRLTSQSLVASNGHPAVHQAMLDGIAQVRATLPAIWQKA
jgi:myo-inositol-1(or 4)-monophosphatase